MAPNPRVVNAFSAMRALGISPTEVKPVLKKLVRVYDGKWELIEDDNYRTLIDAYFEFKEAEGGESTKEMIDDDDDLLVLSTQVSYEDKKKPMKPLEREIIEPSKTSMDDTKHTSSSRPPHVRVGDVEKVSNNSPRMAAKDSTTNPKKASSSAGHCDQEKELEPRNKKPKLQYQPVSTSYHGGSSEASNGKGCLKTLSNQNLVDMQSKDDRLACNNNTTACYGKITIASSPQGEVKLSLNLDSTLLGQPRNFSNPNLDAVMKLMEERYLTSCHSSAGKQVSMMKLLNGLCRIYLKLGAANSRNNLPCLPEQAANHKDERTSSSCRFIRDITKGAEKVKIPLIDETGTEELPKFNYIPTNVIYQSANVNISLARISDEGCCADCSGNCLSTSSLPCACAQETGGEFAYTPQGLLKDEFLTACMSMKDDPQQHHFVYCQECPLEKTKNEYMPEKCKGHLVRKFIKECWNKCGCDMQCGNRVVQRGITCKLQVFLTPEGKGWGLRTLEDLAKGTFVCEYVGEILTNTELYERIVQDSGNERHTYPVTLDADWGSEGVLKDEEALCLDATYNGNVGRFINHRCADANLIDIPVEVETPDHHYYHLAFFTNRKVSAYEELTWDYGIDFDDHEHPIKAFRCSCGSAFCGDKKQKGKSKIENQVRVTRDSSKAVNPLKLVTSRAGGAKRMS